MYERDAKVARAWRICRPRGGLVIYTPNMKRQGVKKNSFAGPSISLVDTKPNVGSLVHYLRTF